MTIIMARNISSDTKDRAMASLSARTSSRNSTSPSRQIISPSAGQSPTTSRLSMTSTSSRLSVTSSNVSLATLETDRGSNFEPLFRTRWDDEAEMDKGLKILKRKQAASIRLRKMNDVYDRLLEGKLRVLDTKFSNVAKELTKETRYIKEEIDDIQPLLFPRIESAAPSVSSRQPSSINGRSHADKICQSCLFDPANTTARCRHFPCFLPMTYNSIGVFPKPQTYSVVTNYKQLLGRCGDLRPATSKRRKVVAEKTEEVKVEQESHAPRTTVKEKIRGLKQLVKEMKERNDKTKPRDWAINYGDPLPRRVILKPVKTT